MGGDSDRVVVLKEGPTGIRSLGLQVAQRDFAIKYQMLPLALAGLKCWSQRQKFPRSETSMNMRDSAVPNPQESQTDLWYI